MYVYGVLTLERGSNDPSFLVARRYSRDSSRISVSRRTSAVNDDAQRLWRTIGAKKPRRYITHLTRTIESFSAPGDLCVAGRVIYQRIDYSLNRLSNTLFGRRGCFVIAFV